MLSKGFVSVKSAREATTQNTLTPFILPYFPLLPLPLPLPFRLLPPLSLLPFVSFITLLEHKETNLNSLSPLSPAFIVLLFFIALLLLLLLLNRNPSAS